MTSVNKWRIVKCLLCVDREVVRKVETTARNLQDAAVARGQCVPDKAAAGNRAASLLRRIAGWDIPSERWGYTVIRRVPHRDRDPNYRRTLVTGIATAEAEFIAEVAPGSITILRR